MTKSQAAYQKLADMIETGQLEAGVVLSEAQLMEIVEIGRTPLREAVQRLSRDHLVKLRSGSGLSGIEVPSLSVDEQLSRLEVRRSLETLAIGLACQRAGEEQLFRIAEHAEVLEGISGVAEYVAGVRRSQALICDAAGNDYLTDAMTPLQGLSRRFWLAHIVDEATEVGTGREHYVSSLRAVVGRDGDRARSGIRALHDHLVDSALAVAGRRAQQGREQASEG